MQTPDDVARVIAALCLDQAAGITGQVFFVQRDRVGLFRPLAVDQEATARGADHRRRRPARCKASRCTRSPRPIDLGQRTARVRRRGAHRLRCHPARPTRHAGGRARWGKAWFVTWLLALAVVPTCASAATSLLGETPAEPEPPFAICDEPYALCAAASCFVYNEVAYCECDIERGDSISLQLDYTTAAGTTQNVCDVDRDGRFNGYMVSTFSLPTDAEKGGRGAVYTCPGSSNARGGVAAPVAYGQCDGALCFTSTVGRRFPASHPGSGATRSSAPARSRPPRHPAARATSAIRCSAPTRRTPLPGSVATRTAVLRAASPRPPRTAASFPSARRPERRSS